MASILKVDTIQDQDGNNIINESANTITIGASGDTITIPSGATLANSGIVTGFESTGIDDNATSTAITIDSSERVGIGTSSPNSQLDITNTTGATGLELHRNFSGNVSGATNSGALDFTLTDTATSNQVVARINSQGEAGTGDAFGGIMRFLTSNSSGTSTERMRINSSGNVGIGISSPAAQLDIRQDGTGSLTKRVQTNIDLSAVTNLLSTDPTLFIQQAGTGSAGVVLKSGTVDFALRLDSSGNFIFDKDTTERMRIDSSGNVLVAQTATNQNVVGISLNTNGNITACRDGGIVGLFNRKTDDGTIISVRKDGAEVGSISVGDGDLLIGKTEVSGECYLRFGYSAVGIIPANANGTQNDNTLDLGNITARFDDIYATNGTIQTSDQNEKQSIQSLTTAEMNVAKRLSSLIKTFKWNSVVEKKGDSARTHTGIIAQDVQQAFTDEGLDAGNYALFISSTWWEKEISVDAVAEEVDENGNVITEAKDAYTYMDTKEEATDGYTERTRLGVRYPELLSFIQAYNDQRFTELEARITTLENA